MNEIKIPFQDWFKGAMLAGVKTMTSRTKFYTQNEGDYFKAFGCTFVITKLFRRFYLHLVESHFILLANMLRGLTDASIKETDKTEVSYPSCHDCSRTILCLCPISASVGGDQYDNYRELGEGD